MKNNLISSKKPKIGFIALLLFFCGLFSSSLSAQNMWWGNTTGDNNWATAANWTGTTRSAHTATFLSGDTVITVNTVGVGGINSLAVAAGQAIVGPGIAPNTTITGFTGTATVPITITLSTATIGAGTASLVYIYAMSAAAPTASNTVFIENSLVGSPVISTAAVALRVELRNSLGAETGTLLTINNGASLTIDSAQASSITLQGGSIVNNGALSLRSTATAASYGINCANPVVLPTVAREYTYSGDGTLSVTLFSTTTALSAAFATTGNSATANLANATYKLVLNNPTITLNQSTINTIGAIRTISATGAAPITPKLIISGTGLTLGTVGTPSIGSLIVVGNATNLTIDTGTVLTLNSATANLNNGLEMTNSLTGTGDAETGTNRTRFTNNGTINIKGNTSANGIRVATFSGASNPIVGITFVNNGTIDVNINATSAATTNSTPAAFQIPNGFGTASTNALLTLTNNGTINLKNTSTATGNGFAIWVTGAGERTKTSFENNSILNIEGTTNNVGQSITFTNNATVNSNSSLNSFVAINNNSSGSINFTQAVNIPASFTVDLAAAATAGSIYTDANSNSYTVGTTKVTGTGTSLGTSFNQLNTVPPSGTLTRFSGTGDATIAYTAVTVTRNAIPSPTTNSGIINTGSGALRTLSTISGVTDASAGTIAPGGTGYGIAELNKAASTPNGTLKIQVAGNTAAGVDYDQLSNSFAASTLALGSLNLNVSFLYTPTGNVSIPIVTVSGLGSTIAVGSFANVTGLTPGWTITQTTTAVTLEYTTGSATATTWNGLALNTDWTNAGNWSAGVPTLSSNVTIAAAANQPVIGTNVNILSLTIDPAASLTVNTGFNLSVIDAITNNGSLTIASNANLIQVNNATNTGNITVNRNSNLLSRLDYTLWSSPVTNPTQFLTTFSPVTDTDRFYTYNESTNLYNAIVGPGPDATQFASATGYLIRMPNTAVTAPATQTFAGVFTGVPNNGTILKGITYLGSGGYNSIGNPYPSTIDAQAFIAANTANIESSLYFWRKINLAASSAYAVYNPMGSTTATPSSPLPNGTIQVGQGFFVKAKSGPVNVSFTNAMRVANIQNQIFKTQQVAQKDRVWLNLSRPASKIGTVDIKEVFSQTLIGYTADAISGVDMYDAKYINDSPTALTSSINNEEYTIQGRPAFDASDVVALNFKNDADVVYTIALDHFDGVFATGQDIYLLDSKTGIETNLKTGSYTFAATAGVDNTRFSLKYQKTLKIDAPAFNDNSVRVYKNNGMLYVNSGNVAISNIKVFDIQGRLIAEQKNVKATSAVISNLRASNQVLIVKIAGEDNSVVTKKVVN